MSRAYAKFRYRWIILLLFLSPSLPEAISYCNPFCPYSHITLTEMLWYRLGFLKHSSLKGFWFTASADKYSMRVSFVSKQGADDVGLIFSLTAGRPRLLSELTRGSEVTRCTCAFVCFQVCMSFSLHKAAMRSSLSRLVGWVWACSVKN